MKLSASLMLVCSCALLGSSCSDDESAPETSDSGDVGGDVGEPDFGSATGALTPPEPPVLTPCAEGWREVAPGDGAEVATCEPFPAGGASECASDEAQFPGESDCSRVGTPCPEDDWPADLPSDSPVLYVLAGAPIEGVGTRESPFATLAEATAAAEPGTVIALATGTFDELVELTTGVTLWGACVAETVVAASEPGESGGTLTVVGEDVVVRNLQVSGDRPGIWVGDGASAHIGQTVIDGTVGAGLRVAGGRATAERLVIRETRFVSDHEAEPGEILPELGPGLHVSNGAVVTVSRALFEHNQTIGVLAEDAGSSLEFTDVAVRDSAVGTGPDGVPTAVGLFARSGAEVTVARALFELNAREERGPPVFLANVLGSVAAEAPGTLIRLTDTVVRSRDGMGLAVGGGARIEVSRALFDENQFLTLFGFRATPPIEEPTLAVSDAIVRNTFHDPTVPVAAGLLVDEGVRAELERVVFSNNMGVAVVAFNDGATVNATDLVIDETLELECDGECPNGGLGIGVSAVDGALADMTRFKISGSRLCGVQLAASPRVPPPAGFEDGDGIDGEPPTRPGGVIDLHEGEVSGNLIGVNVQTDPFDLDRLTDRVVYLENERNLDTTALPVPNPFLPPL